MTKATKKKKPVAKKVTPIKSAKKAAAAKKAAPTAEGKLAELRASLDNLNKAHQQHAGQLQAIEQQILMTQGAIQTLEELSGAKKDG